MYTKTEEDELSRLGAFDINIQDPFFIYLVPSLSFNPKGSSFHCFFSFVMIPVRS